MALYVDLQEVDRLKGILVHDLFDACRIDRCDLAVRIAERVKTADAAALLRSEERQTFRGSIGDGARIDRHGRAFSKARCQLLAVLAIRLETEDAPAEFFEMSRAAALVRSNIEEDMTAPPPLIHQARDDRRLVDVCLGCAVEVKARGRLSVAGRTLFRLQLLKASERNKIDPRLPAAVPHANVVRLQNLEDLPPAIQVQVGDRVREGVFVALQLIVLHEVVRVVLRRCADFENIAALPFGFVYFLDVVRIDAHQLNASIAELCPDQRGVAAGRERHRGEES